MSAPDEFVPIAPEGDVAEGDVLIRPHRDRLVLLVRVRGEVKAYDGHCPHARTSLLAGPLLDGRHIECPMHGALFDAADGALQPGPITCPHLPAWPLRITDGQVEVAVPPRTPSTTHGQPSGWALPGSVPRTTTYDTTTRGNR